jgi:hypothetical protein
MDCWLCSCSLASHVWLVNKCTQIFFGDKVLHLTSVPVAVNSDTQEVWVLGKERVRGFGVVAWGVGSSSSNKKK